MPHPDASRPPTTRGQTDRAVPAGRRPTPIGAQRGFTQSEVALIHATAQAHGLAIDICTVVVPDGTFPPTPDGTPRPEVARILTSLRKNTPNQPQGRDRTAGFGTLASSEADRAGTRPAGVPAREQLAVRADAAAPSRAAAAVAYDRQAHDLDTSHRLAITSDTTSALDDAALDAVATDAPEAHRG